MMRYRWLILRRSSQLGILGLFLLGPLMQIWIIKGNLSSSLLFNTVPMNDPFILLQSLAAGHWPIQQAWLGAVVVLILYLLVGGRTYCSWVCPINVVTDSAAWLHKRFELAPRRRPVRELRIWLIATILISCAVTGNIVWELVNPISLLHRGLLFGMGLGWLVVFGIFIYDLLIAPRGWCGHICPVGAFYGVIGKFSLLRISAARRTQCNDCMDCFAVCPEPHVITPALKGTDSPIILAKDCTNCGRCIDVCAPDVFNFTHRFDSRRDVP
ncbi:MAG: quinol dehydrogenase ferredoxin subunit NapH [Gallionellaceae bacterium]|nr:quinol dehydrogenase ferredoxin subunit NapH [Gallionellaceae bacterium]